MIVFLSILLLVNAAFAFLVWPTFYKRVAGDARARDAAGKPTKFLTVHRVLIGAAFLIAGVSTVAAIIAFFV